MAALRRLTPLVLASVLGVMGAELSGAGVRRGGSALRAQTQALMLRLQRRADALDVVIEGVGSQPVLQQRQNGSNWEGRLRTQGSRALDPGGQRLSLPELGIETVSLSGSGDQFELLVRRLPGQAVQDPVVSADGRNLILTFNGLGTPQLQTGRLDLNTPGRVPQSRFAPPLRPRAVAPPLGDMAVGTMVLRNRSFVNVSGPPVTLTLNNAPAKDALMSLARLGGYGFVYVGDDSTANGIFQGGSASNSGGSGSERSVTMSFLNESYSRALNGVLAASGLQAKKDGRTLLVGSGLKLAGFGPSMSKVFRLNQVSADSAAQYLASVGAQICVPQTSQTIANETVSAGTPSASSSSSSSTTSETTEIKCYGSGKGPLSGLEGTTDSRLQTATLIGDPQLVAVAENYLKNLDLRRRQVAVKVQILNIDLKNDKSIDASFSARIGNTFIVSESGKAFMNFGDYKPGNSQGTGLLGRGSPYTTPGSYTAGVPSVPAQDVVAPFSAAQDVVRPFSAAQDIVRPSFEAQDVVPPYVPKLAEARIIENPVTGEVTLVEVPYIDPVTNQKVYVPDPNPNAGSQFVPRVDANGQPIYVPSANPSDGPVLIPRYDKNGQLVYVPSTNPADSPSLIPRYDKNGRPVYVPGKDPSEFSYPKNSFYGYLEAVIESTSAKTLAAPTLLVQEGEKARVETGTSVITGVDSTETANGSTQFKNTRENAGLTLDVVVDKIDDNGFVTLNVNPSVSVPIPAGLQQGVPIFNITGRKLSSGRIRLRDRQTLVLTGVIQDSDREVVRKWPILGDMPVIGQMFRSTDSQREKQELVILVSPAIIDDEQGGSYGYGYRPSSQEARQLMRSSY